MAGLAAHGGHPSSSCLCSGFLFGEFADDTNEGSVLVLQPLVVRLQLCQNLQRDREEVRSRRGGMSPYGSEGTAGTLRPLRPAHY